METRIAITSRRDERGYQPEPLPDGVVERVLDAGRLAGSARNRQPWTFVVVEPGSRRDRLAAVVYVPENVSSAALVVAVVVAGGSATTSFDAGRAAQNMLLAAWDAGLASCPNGVADEAQARVVLEVEGDDRVAIVLTFGLPGRERDPAARSADEWSARANRRPLGDVVRRLT